MTTSSPSAKDMGPIERELRGAWALDADSFDDWYWKEPHSLAACQVIGGAIKSLGIVGESTWTFRLFFRDIMSEAIEAASELGL